MFKVVHGVVNIVCALVAIMFEAILATDIIYMLENPIARSELTMIMEAALFALCVIVSVTLVTDLIRRNDKL